MTSQQHPITPPPALVEQWLEQSLTSRELAAKAFQAGADQELEACCDWLDRNNQWARCDIDELHDARRPKPQTLNSIALQMLATIERHAYYLPEITDTIRCALEALDD